MNNLLELLGNDQEPGPLRPPFSYLGSKSKALNQIYKYVPYRYKYIEPFGGSMALLLSREISPIEVYNDKWGGVVCFYRVLRDEAKYKKLVERLEQVCFSREEFLWCRDTWFDCEDDVERAARWFYKMQASFAAKGVNFGRTTDDEYSFFGKIVGRLGLFKDVHRRIKNVIIENTDYKDIFNDYDSEDAVFYCDPPYAGTDQSGYGGNRFNGSDFEDLCDLVFSLKGFVAISTYYIDTLAKYNWDNIVMFEKRAECTTKKPTEGNNHNMSFTRYNVECLCIKEIRCK